MQPFPSLPSSGNRVDAKSLVEPGTSLAVTTSWIVGLILLAVASLVTMGFALIGVVLTPIFSWFQHRKALALIHGSGVKISESQCPEIHKVVAEYSRRLGIDAPEVYVVESNILNAYAVRFGKSNLILLTDEIINACMMAEKPSALCFILGHELGHIALGHNNTIRTFFKSVNKKVSRLDEYSADRVATALAQDKDDAITGLILLTVGPQLAKYLNESALKEQIDQVVRNKDSQKAERPLTHPLLLHRLNKIGID